MGLIQFITSLGKKKSDPSKNYPDQADGYKPVHASEHDDHKLTPTTTTTSSQQHEHEGFGSSFSMRFNEDNVPTTATTTTTTAAAAASSPPRFGNTRIPSPTPDEGGGSVTPHWEPYYLFGKSSNPANEHYIKIHE
ncbi:hypothetical protein K492DRAFT_225017 [Lichtheimia hyalospora FSU 10163]|nr:hypothetical protein K492DRAFT_225017 [Lichtheimia hyalospora FSU 10163]